MFKCDIYSAIIHFIAAKSVIQLRDFERLWNYPNCGWINRLDLLINIWLMMRTSPRRLIWKPMKSCHKKKCWICISIKHFCSQKQVIKRRTFPSFCTMFWEMTFIHLTWFFFFFHIGDVHNKCCSPAGCLTLVNFQVEYVEKGITLSGRVYCPCPICPVQARLA